jgi:hypothetical protein
MSHWMNENRPRTFGRSSFAIRVISIRSNGLPPSPCAAPPGGAVRALFATASGLALRHGKRFRRACERFVCQRRDFIEPGFKRSPHVFNHSLARAHPGFLPRLRFPAQHHKLAQISGVHRALRRRVYNIRFHGYAALFRMGLNEPGCFY